MPVQSIFQYRDVLVTKAQTRPRIWSNSSTARRGAGVFARIALVAVMAALVVGCASTPPKRQADLCAVFEQHPDWYDYARDSVKEWGTPVHVLMAFVRHESSYRAKAKPPFKWFLFIPLGRASSAKGYAQAQDPVWGEYQEERGGLFRSRSDMEDALDFIGWYNHKTCASSASTGPMPTGSTLPTTRDGEGIGAVPGRRSPRCSATRKESARLHSPTSRSSHAVKIASAATPGIRSGRCAVEGRGKDHRHYAVIPRL